MAPGAQRRACQQAPPRTSYLSRAAHPASFGRGSLSDTAAVSDPGLFISRCASLRGGPRQAFGSLPRPLRKRSLRTRVARGLRPCSPTRRGRRVRASSASWLKAWHADVRAIAREHVRAGTSSVLACGTRRARPGACARHRARPAAARRRRAAKAEKGPCPGIGSTTIGRLRRRSRRFSFFSGTSSVLLRGAGRARARDRGAQRRQPRAPQMPRAEDEHGT
jgi:hypothetical protein